MKRVTLYLLGIIVFIGCSNTNKRDENKIQTVNELNISIQSKLKNDILKNGDIDAYEKLSNYYMDFQIPEELMFYSLVMANDFNYPQANYDVYVNICLHYKRTGRISLGMSELALMHLIKASKLGHHQAIEEVKEYNINKASDPIATIKELLIN